jgi:cytochrome bd-type quinol oxidase subunit 2
VPERSGRPTGTGPGRVLVAVYGLFALSASARAGVQIATKFHEAPLAYLLSALAAVIYIVATVALARNGRRLALVCCSTELLGVLAVGTASLLDRAAFPDATVWSGYGAGYGFVPLVLPVLGLWWLSRTRRA